MSRSGNGGYAEVSLGQSERMTTGLNLSPSLTPTMEHGEFITIWEGESVRDMIQRRKAIPALMSHEVAHILQEEKEIPKPVIKGNFPNFDIEIITERANEVLVDRLALGIARKHLPVKGLKNPLEKDREIAFIESYLILAQVVVNNSVRTNNSPVSNECLAERIAVFNQLAKNPNIDEQTKTGLLKVSLEFRNKLAANLKETSKEETNKLIRLYEDIFRRRSRRI